MLNLYKSKDFTIFHSLWDVHLPDQPFHSLIILPQGSNAQHLSAVLWFLSADLWFLSAELYFLSADLWFLSAELSTENEELFLSFIEDEYYSLNKKP